MLICLKPGKSKAFCENKICKKRLIGPFKILRRGNGYAFHVCMKCFHAIMHKGIDRYLPGKTDLLKSVALDAQTGAKLQDAGAIPYVPEGTQKIPGELLVVENPKTGQIML